MTENYIYSERIICSCPADDTTRYWVWWEKVLQVSHILIFYQLEQFSKKEYYLLKAGVKKNYKKKMITWINKPNFIYQNIKCKEIAYVLFIHVEEECN